MERQPKLIAKAYRMGQDDPVPSSSEAAKPDGDLRLLLRNAPAGRSRAIGVQFAVLSLCVVERGSPDRVLFLARGLSLGYERPVLALRVNFLRSLIDPGEKAHDAHAAHDDEDEREAQNLASCRGCREEQEAEDEDGSANGE
jgi:hypothetical protein